MLSLLPKSDYEDSLTSQNNGEEIIKMDKIKNIDTEKQLYKIKKGTKTRKRRNIKKQKEIRCENLNQVNNEENHEKSKKNEQFLNDISSLPYIDFTEVFPINEAVYL